MGCQVINIIKNAPASRRLTPRRVIYAVYHEARVPNALRVPQLSFIDNMPSQKTLVHDIRLRFITEGIWSTIRRTHPELIPNEVSKDISLSPIQTYYMEAKTVVYHSDTVSVIISCSMKPVVVDQGGLIRLSNILTSVEEKLLALVTGSRTQYPHCRNSHSKS